MCSVFSAIWSGVSPPNFVSLYRASSSRISSTEERFDQFSPFSSRGRLFEKAQFSWVYPSARRPSLIG